jgi:multidrug efflux pump subunit AcrA (membrane-fusion protein)
MSVHEVRRGNMLLRQNFLGSVTSLNPPTVTFSDPRTDVLRVGQKASFQIKPPTVLTGRVVRVGSATADVELADSLPDGTSVGSQLGAMVEVGEASDIVFLDRPADARPNTETIIFLIEPDDQHAKRVPVHYGRISGPQIEILSGLSPGDRVIVTDMSKWASYARVTLK